MKTIVTILALCLWLGVCQGQKRNEIIDQYGRPVNYGVSALTSQIPVFLSVDKNTRSIDPFNALPHDPLGTFVVTEGASSISVTTRVKKDSLNYYRYSVIENDTVIVKRDVKLEHVNFVWNERSDFPGQLTMKLGLPSVVNKKLTIRLYRLPEESRVTTVVIYNKSLQRAVSQGIFLGSIDKQSKAGFVMTRLANDTRFTITDQTKGISVAIQKTDLDFVYYVILKNKVGEQENVAFASNSWSYNTLNGNPAIGIPVDYFRTPGEYQLSIVPQIGSGIPLRSMEEKSLTSSFTVLAPIAYSIQEIVVGLVILLLIVLGMVYLIRRNARRKLLAAKLQTAAAESELENVRSQLNPHFVFNALGGIQNLINKNEIGPANEYLSRFARLTRHILNNEAKISIKDEVDLLEDYISMEKLRFPFEYTVHVADELNNNTEIPTMLIQPFVENAVKHAMAPLKGKGTIAVSFDKEGSNLVITITDTGAGFTVEAEYSGLGLKLTKKRISLLNDLYKECPIYLTIDSGSGETTCKIVLSQWL